ncbi:hypothetical protein COCOBI_11-1010 [Coccomyxa sp. Obi]|nr:hypothetical protein COCOBI_11-1010 [Coccomyxa sp. Obi]
MSQSVERIHDGHTEDKVAHERNRSRVTEEKQTESQQAGLNIARAHEAPAELSPADAFEAALAEALARQSRQESAGVGNSQESGQGRCTLTPPNTPALGTSPPTLETGAVREPRAGGSPPGTAMHAIPEEAEGTVVEDRAILPAPTVQPKKAETAAAAALSSPVPFDDQVTDLASAIVPEQYGKLFKEPTSPATMVGGQRPEAEQLGREWSVPVAGTLHVAKALENLDTQGEKTVPKAEAAQEDSEPKAPPCTGTPTPDRRSNNGYATDVEDEAAGGPKGDLQSHISRNIAAPTTEATGGTAEAQALASYERFPPPQGPMQEPRPEAERKEEAGELQLGGQPPQQQEQRSPGVTAASAEQQVAQPLTGRRIVLQEQAAAQAPTPRPAPRRQQVQEPAVLLEEETVLLGGPERSAARSIPVGGPLAPEIGPESRSAPTITSIPGQWGDSISGAFGDGLRGMQPSVGRTAATVASAAWGAPEQAPSSSKASKTRAGARASKLKDAAYGVLYALDDVAHAAALARGNLGVIIAEAVITFPPVCNGGFRDLYQITPNWGV